MRTQLQRRDPVSDAIASLFLLGLGQWFQHRRAAAVYFVGEVTVAVAIGALVPELRTLAWLSAAVVTGWSVVDAAIVARRAGKVI